MNIWQYNYNPVYDTYLQATWQVDPKKKEKIWNE